MQLEVPPNLPNPDSHSAAHSERCAEFVRARIESAGGSISFAEYMQHALYAPGLGYYTAGAAKFGRNGDFVTAPEVSPLFGAVVARQCAEVLQQSGGGSILEFGAGSGRLAVDVLRKLEELGALPRRYRILEVSADLRQRQEALLRKDAAHLVDRVEWIAAIPGKHNGVILANEVLDAMPVERFVRRATVQQQRVAIVGDAFTIVEADAPEILAKAVAAIEADIGAPLPAGFVSEVSLGAGPWVEEMLASLTCGAAFLFDYGLGRREYYAAERHDGWLRCHFRHHAHNDPLVLPGIQDVTAWVDFTAVAEAAVKAGADIAGFVPQAQFLLSGGLQAELRELDKLPPQQQLELSGQVKLLTLPGEMGEHFKCLGLTRGRIDQPTAFFAADRTHSL